MAAYEVRLELLEAEGGSAPIPRPTAALLAQLQDLASSRCHRLVLAGGRHVLRHPGLPELAAAAADLGIRDLVVATTGLGLTEPGALARLEEAGVTTLSLTVGGIRRRVYESVTGEPGGWRAAMQGLADAVASPLAVEIVVPLVRATVDDVVPLYEWLRELPAPVSGFYLQLPLSGPQQVAYDEVARVAARVFDRARRHGIAYGFADRRGPSPCTAGEALDRHGTIYVQRLQRLADGQTPLSRVAACETCALRYACQGLEVGYLEAFGSDAATPVSLERSTAWRLRKIDDRQAHDYKNVSAFDNAHAGHGRSLVRINGHCQMACSFCFVDRTVPDFDTTALRDEITELAARHTDHLVLSGGEPTLHPGLPELVAHAKALGFATIEIQTNGVKAARREYAQSLVDAGLTKVTTSLHSVDPDKSNAITKMNGAFDKTIAGLSNFRDLGVQTQIAHVITKANYADLGTFVDFLTDRFGDDPRHLSICFAIAQGISDLVYRWTIPRFSDIRPHLRAALDRCLAVGFGFGGLIGQGGYPPCMLDGELKYYRPNFRNIYVSADYAQQFTKASRCTECSFEPYCVGVRRDYVACYGDDELRPFRADPAALADCRRLPPPRPVDPAQGHMSRDLVRLRPRPASTPSDR